MIYLFFGEDSETKNRHLVELKQKFFPQKEALEFDYEILYAFKLDSETLKKALLALPVLAPERLMVIREIHRLSPHNKELIVEFLKESSQHASIVLDSDETQIDEDFIRKLKPSLKVVDCSKGEKTDVFDLTRAISFGKSVEALKILDGILSEGVQPLQIMGGLVWFWGKSRARMQSAEYQKGLRALKEADVNIKRSRLEPGQALEVLVVKLSLKEAG